MEDRADGRFLQHSECQPDSYCRNGIQHVGARDAGRMAKRHQPFARAAYQVRCAPRFLARRKRMWACCAKATAVPSPFTFTIAQEPTPKRAGWGIPKNQNHKSRSLGASTAPRDDILFYPRQLCGPYAGRGLESRV